MAGVLPIDRKPKLAQMLAKVNEDFSSHLKTAQEYASGKDVSVDGALYSPINPSKKILQAVVGKGAVMPSAAKFPVMVFFDSVNESTREQSRSAYIFKVGDDVRQDVLALQIIEILSRAFKRVGLESFLYPYGTLPNGYETGIIEVVPNTQSRSGTYGPSPLSQTSRIRDQSVQTYLRPPSAQDLAMFLMVVYTTSS